MQTKNKPFLSYGRHGALLKFIVNISSSACTIYGFSFYVNNRMNTGNIEVDKNKPATSASGIESPNKTH